MAIDKEEVKRRIEAARILRRIDQKELDRRGAADGFGKGEMGRVERGELPFRPGKHLDPLCRYLQVPRWWFTAEKLNFGGIGGKLEPDEIGSLLAQQTLILEEIKARIVEERELLASEGDEFVRRVADAARRELQDDAQNQEEDTRKREQSGTPRS